MSSSNCYFLTCIQISQEAGQVIWYSHLFKNFPQFVVIHTKTGIVNNAEVDVFLELSWFLDDPADVGSLISGFSAFSKSSLNIWKFMVYVLLKPVLENFEHYFASVCDECSCAVVWAFSKEYNQMVTSTWRDVPHHHVISRSSFSFYLAACVQSCPTLCDPVDSSLPGSSVHGILRPKYWSWLPLPIPRDPPNPGIKPKSLCLLHWQTDSLPLHHLGSPYLAAPRLSCGISDL